MKPEDLRPMLACPAVLDKLQFPLFGSPKLDGVRCLIVGGRAMSRKLKLIPHHYVQAKLGAQKYSGLDGELIVGPAAAPDAYNTTVSAVMAHGESTEKLDLTFWVFDNWLLPTPYCKRLGALENRVGVGHSTIKLLPQVHLANMDELLAYEEATLVLGYEGVMVRSPSGIYKPGRSTVTEGYLLKVKRFEDSEAKIIDMVPLMHNGNEAKVNELGYTKRSSHKANKTALPMMGALCVRDIHTNVEFEIGTGFTAEQRKKFWEDPSIMGQIVKYKFQPAGVKDKPRFPVFLGFRDLIDM